MEQRDGRERRGRTGTAIAVAGAGAALLWFLLRRGDGELGRAGEGARKKLSRCRVYVDSNGILTLNNEASDVLRAAQLCDRVLFQAAGDAPFGVVADVREALEKAGLIVKEEAP